MKGTTADRSNRWPWLQQTLRTTKWSLVARVRRSTGANPAEAAEEFCQYYWYPLYAFLRRSGYSESDAQDHVQSFLVRAVEEDLLASADPARGRLRNFLITLLTRHVSSRRRHEHAQKRGGGATMLPLEWAGAEEAFRQHAGNASSPEEAYRRALAEQLVAEGVAALRRHYVASKQLALCEALMPALEGPLRDETYEEVAARLGMRPGAVRTAATRMRERFRIAVRESASGVLGIKVGPELDAELREIFCGQAQPTGL